MIKKVILLCAVFACLGSSAFAKFDPAFTWTTLETPHFYIHYHQGGEEIAKRVAVLAEDVHTRLVPRIAWEPKDKTRLVLVDAVDDPNGMATTLPYNRVVLYLTRPVGEPGFGTTAYDDWLRMIITHEYTHILQLDMVTGVPRILQTIFGRIYFPNFFEPIWMIEGLATYEETEQTAGGRGRSPGSEMVIRMAVLEDRFPELSQATVYPDPWPGGDTPYLFGEAFTRYIANTYGREKLADLSVVYSGRGVPFLVESTAERVLQKKYRDLWNDWHNRLWTRYARQRDEIMARGLTASQALTRRGYLNVSPAFSPDGKRIAYAVSNADEFPGIYLMNADGTDDRKVVDNIFPASASGRVISWGPDGNGFYYTKIEVQRNTNFYDDIYYFDLENNKEVRITRGLRARDPSPSADNRMLVFVLNRMGRTRIAAIEIPKEKGREITEDDVAYLTEESGNQYESPRFNPDRSRIAVGVRQPDGYKDIWIIDGLGSTVAELMHDRAIDGGAAWSPDGKLLYFASDRTGIFNLFAYEIETRKTYQLTNVLGGAFSPAPSPDGKTLAFSSYSARGYDIRTQPADPASWTPAQPAIESAPTITYDEKPVETTTRSYSPLSTIYPRFWLPWFGSSTESGTLYGFLTFGQDALERHSYLLTGLYGPNRHRTWYSFNYQYDGLYPTLGVEAVDHDKTYTDLLTDQTGTTSYGEREQVIGASVSIPLIKTQVQHTLTIGLRRRRISALTLLPPWPGYSGPVPAQGVLASGRARYVFNNAKRFGNSISPENGRTIAIGGEQFDRSLGSDFQFTRYTADWHEYLNLPWRHHVLQARGFAGAAKGKMIPQRAFQLGGDSPGDTLLPLDEDSLFLRGYPANAFRGRKAAFAGLEYRFPIDIIEAGWGSLPIYLRRVHGAVFAEAGNAWDDHFSSADLKRSVGVEARLDTYLAYRLPITFRVVVTKGLDEKGEVLIYFGLWMPGVL